MAYMAADLRLSVFCGCKAACQTHGQTERMQGDTQKNVYGYMAPTPGLILQFDRSTMKWPATIENNHSDICGDALVFGSVHGL